MGKEMRDMIKKENKLCFKHRMERKTEKSFQLSAGRQRLLAETIRELKQEGRLDEEKLAMQHHLPPQPQCCLHKPLDDGTVADSLGTKITCERGIAARLFFV